MLGVESVKKRLDQKRKPSLDAFYTKVMWSFQERGHPGVTPNIAILSQNSNELKSMEMSERSLSSRLEIRQLFVLSVLKFTKL